MLTSISLSAYKFHTPSYWLIRDEFKDRTYERRKQIIPRKELLFHIAKGDYILTLVTFLRFFEESMLSGGIDTNETKNLKLEVMKGVINDLLYLNDNHYVIKKSDEFNKK